MTYLLLFYEFFKTGLFAVGGGLATLPFLYDMAARHPEWFTTSQLADMVAVSESTPGPLGVNMATYVGFITGGIPGALVSTIGLVTPSIIIILIVAAFLKRFRDSKLVNAVFYGLRPASTAMVASAGAGGGHSRGGARTGEYRCGRAGARQLEGRGARGRSARADALVQGHEGPAPDSLHPRKRRRRRVILVLSSSKKVHLF